MKQEIKERVEKIQKGEVPEGYRKTKVGIIPVEWLVSLTDNVAKRGTGHTPNKKFPSYYNGGIKWISLQDSNKLDNGLIFHTKVEISEEGLSNSSAVLHPKGSVLISRDAGVGKSAIMGNDMSVSQHFITWTCSNKLNNWYLYYYLQKRKSDFERMAVGSTIKTIGMPFFKKYEIPLPPIKEQEKIVEILSTWDKAIELKEKLIIEINEFKRGVMQKLLTGEMRFPEFTGELEQKKLGDIFSERKETNQNGSELLSITSSRGVIKRSEIEGKDNSNKDKSKYKKICCGDIGYNTMRMWQGVSAVSEYEGIVSPAYTVIKLKQDGDIYYFGYLFKLRKIINLFWRHSQGLVNDTLNLKYENFKIIKVTVPTSKEEQENISFTLKSIDKEISLIKAEKELLEKQKRGLMQLLLTGIVRVEVN